MTMKVYINDRPVHILPGMTVKHAILNAGFLNELDSPKRVFDEWGNEIGLDGALTEGVKIYIRKSENEP
jgi:hypothetical protein